MSVKAAGGAGEAAVGGGAATTTTGKPLEFGDQSLLEELSTKYARYGHNIYGNRGSYTVKSGRSIEHAGKLYYVIEKGSKELKDLQEELDMLKYVSDPEYASAPHVSKLVAAKLNPTPSTERKRHVYSGLFVFDLENSQAMDLRQFLQRGMDRRVGVTRQKIYDDLHAAIEALHSIGVIHRDIKPENIIILYKVLSDDGKLLSPPYPYVGLRIIDFGFAVELGSEISFAGTIAYAPSMSTYPATAQPNLNKYSLEIIARNNLGPGISRKPRRTRRHRSRRSRTRA